MLGLFRRYGIIIVAVFFVVVIALLCILGMASLNKYKSGIDIRNVQIKDLESVLFDIGDIKNGYVLNQSVRAGEKITDELLQDVSIPDKLGVKVVSDREEIVGKYFRISLEEGTILTKDTILERRMDDTFRYYDLITDELPIGIEKGDYIDVRIAFPFGEDFIAISHKRVEEINSGIIKVILNESEIYAYQSMLLDKAIYRGSKIYAVEYIDAGAQAVAEVYYPLNKNLAELSEMNPNLLELVKQKMILKRSQVDSIVGGGVETKSEEDLERISQEISRIRSTMSTNILNSQRDLDRRLEQERREAENLNH